MTTDQDLPEQRHQSTRPIADLADTMPNALDTVTGSL